MIRIVVLAIVLIALVIGCTERNTYVTESGADSLGAPPDSTVPALPETVWVPSPPETVLVQPDWDCVVDCIEANGMPHIRDCLGACLPAQ